MKDIIRRNLSYYLAGESRQNARDPLFGNMLKLLFQRNF